MQVRFDDLRPGHRRGFRFVDPVEVVTTDSVAAVGEVIAAAEDHAAAGRWVAGFLCYEAAPGIDPVLVTHPGPSGMPLAWFAVFDRRELNPPWPPDLPHLLGAWEPGLARSEYGAALAAIHRLIRAGDTYQVNFTMRMRGRFSGDALSAYADLVSAQAGGFGAFVDIGHLQILSASPELFFRWDDEGITTRPMKGTSRRGRWPAEDEQRRRRLEASEKDRAENLMIVDLVRNDLGRIAEFGSVQVTDLFSVERFETLWQMTSTIKATPRPEVGLLDVLSALFPSGSVTGAPKARTMEIIRELEMAPRGLYCGAVGLLAPPGSGEPRAEFNVAIRTVVIEDQSGAAEYGTGGGITWDSVTAAEYDEALVKAEVLSHRAPDFSLLETMLWRPGEGIVRLGSHLDRLSRSAGYFGRPYPAADIEAGLAAVGGDVELRVRLVVDDGGGVTIEHAPLVAGTQPVRLAIDGERVDSQHVLLFHKTTNREVYEAAIGRHPSVDDVVLVNELGLATETTTANLAARFGEDWVTPPIEDGCLPGVLRAELIEGGRLLVRSLPVAQLEEADELAVLSSLRGWRPAVLI